MEDNKAALNVANVITALTNENQELTNENLELKKHIEELEDMLSNVTIIDNIIYSPTPTPPAPAPTPVGDQTQDEEVQPEGKKKRKCGICGVVGHNLRTCPEKHKYCLYIKKKDDK